MKAMQYKIIIVSIFLCVLGVVATIGAQSKSRGKATPAATATNAVADDTLAAAEFVKKCAVCHKTDGRGGNEVPDFTNPAFHKSRTDARLPSPSIRLSE